MFRCSPKGSDGDERKAGHRLSFDEAKIESDMLIAAEESAGRERRPSLVESNEIWPTEARPDVYGNLQTIIKICE